MSAPNTEPGPTCTDGDWFTIHRHLSEGRPAILGFGSYEAHGPHLPLNTDTVIADALVTALSNRIGAVALPTLPFGATSRPRSGGGDLFPLPALRLPTLYGVVADLVHGILEAGCSRLVVLTGHFENSTVLWDALRGATHKRPIEVVLFDAPWELIDESSFTALHPGESLNWAADHAGVLETALMLHLAPNTVGTAPAPWPGRPRGYDVLPTPDDAVPATGVVNDARTATAQAGERCFEAMVAAMHRCLRSEHWPVPQPSSEALPDT